MNKEANKIREDYEWVLQNLSEYMLNIIHQYNITKTEALEIYERGLARVDLWVLYKIWESSLYTNKESSK